MTVFFVIQVGYVLVLNHFTHRLSVSKVLLYLATGGIGCTILLGCFAFYHKGYFLFFKPQLWAALKFSSQVSGLGGAGSPWKSPFSEWIANAVWLILPTTSFFLSLEYLKNKFSVFKESISCHQELDISFLFSYILVSNFLILFSFYGFFEILGFNFFEFDFLACYVYPYAIVVLGVILREFKLKDAKLKNYRFSLFAIIILAIILFLSSHPIYFGLHTILIIIGLMLASAVNFKVFPLTIFMSIQVFSYCYVLQNKIKNVFSVTNFGSDGQDIVLKTKSADYLLMIKVSTLIKQVIPNKEKPLFWYDCNPETETLNNFILATAETFLGGYMTDGPNAAFSKYFPQLDNHMVEEAFKNKNTIILLSSDPDAMQKAEKALKQKGYDWDTLKQKTFSLGEKKFLMIAFFLKSLKDS